MRGLPALPGEAARGDPRRTKGKVAGWKPGISGACLTLCATVRVIWRGGQSRSTPF